DARRPRVQAGDVSQRRPRGAPPVRRKPVRPGAGGGVLPPRARAQRTRPASQRRELAQAATLAGGALARCELATCAAARYRLRRTEESRNAWTTVASNWLPAHRESSTHAS